MIEDAYEIAKIKTSLLGKPIKTYTSQVGHLGRTTQRHDAEVVVATDRQGINIYDIPGTRDITSYDLDLDSLLSCAAASAYIPSVIPSGATNGATNGTTSGTTGYRLTYCSLIAPRCQLHLFREEEDDNRTITTAKINLDLTEHDRIAKLAVIRRCLASPPESSSIQCLAISQNGKISCFDANLQDCLWSSQIDSGTQELDDTTPSTLCRYLLFSVHSLGQIHKSLPLLLEHAPAVLEMEKLDAEEPILLALVLNKSGHKDKPITGISLQAFLIPADMSKDNQALRQHQETNVLTRIFSVPVPLHSQYSARGSTWSLDIENGMLLQQSQTGSARYHLNDLQTRKPDLMDFCNVKLQSAMNLPGEFIATSQNSHIYISNVSLNALYDRYTSPAALNRRSSPDHLREGQSVHVNGASSQDERDDSAGHIRLISYHPKEHLLAILQGGKLSALPLDLPDSASRKRKRGGLADALGRGSLYKANPTTKGDQTHKAKMTFGRAIDYPSTSDTFAQQTSLSKLATDGHVAEFDRIMLAELSQLDEMDLATRESKISFLYDSIFENKSMTTSSDNDQQSLHTDLHIKFWPPQSCAWLIKHNLLTPDRLFRRKCIPSSSTEPHSYGILWRALAAQPERFHCINSILESQAYLQPQDLASALLVIMQHYTKGHSASIMSSQGESEKIDGHELSTTETKNHTTSNQKRAYAALKQLMLRMHQIPSAALVHALKSQLSQEELRFAIDLVRVQIAADGWLTSREDEISSNLRALDKSSPLGLDHHVHLLNGLVDAITPAGWIFDASETSTHASSMRLLHMKAEVSAALEGVEEAVYLKGFLNEFLLACKPTFKLASASASASASGLATNASEVLQIDNGSESIVADDTAINTISPSLDSLDGKLLPLGLRFKTDLPLIKTGVGGTTRRSARDIGYQKSQRVGLYTRERIEV